MEFDDLQQAHLIELPKINDPRGNLTFIESGQDVPFKVMRNYWIYDVSSCMCLDGHALRYQH